MIEEISKTALITLAAGGVSFLAMGWAHELVKHKRLGFVARYIIGSASCLIALTISLVFLAGNNWWLLAANAWGIWIITFLAVVFAYRNDKVRAIRREQRERDIISGEQQQVHSNHN